MRDVLKPFLNLATVRPQRAINFISPTIDYNRGPNSIIRLFTITKIHYKILSKNLQRKMSFKKVSTTYRDESRVGEIIH